MGMMKLVISMTGNLTQPKNKEVGVHEVYVIGRMAYDILMRLIQSDSLRGKTIVLKDRSIITGGSIIEVNRSEIRYLGGESNIEELTVPIERVMEIRSNHNLLYRRKKKIDRIYPRG